MTKNPCDITAEALRYAAMYLLLRGHSTKGLDWDQPYTAYRIAPDYPPTTIAGAIAAWVQREPAYHLGPIGRQLGERIFRTALATVATWIDDPGLALSPITVDIDTDRFLDFTEVHAFEVLEAARPEKIVDS